MLNTAYVPNWTNNFLRTVARSWSIVSVGFVLLILIGEGLGSAPLSQQEWLLFAFLPVGLLLGLLMTWRWDGLGGAVITISFLGFYAVHYLTSGRLPSGPWFALFAVPGPLFLICWMMDREGG